VGLNDVLTASHLLYRIQDGGAASSVTIYPGTDNGTVPFGPFFAAEWSYYPIDLNGDGLVSKDESQLDVGIIGFSTSIGSQTGWFGIDPFGTSGFYNLTGYPGVYSGPYGPRMTNDYGYVTEDASYFLFNYVDIESNQGNSGGPLWYQGAGGPYVVGVASTGSWAADVALNFAPIMSWIYGNNDLINLPNVDVASASQNVYESMYGSAPNLTQLNVLVGFSANQADSGIQVGVLDPTVSVYEALGLALNQGPIFQSEYAPSILPSDATFASEAYLDVFDHPGSPVQIQHFVTQVDFFEAIYTASGAYGTDAAYIDLLARAAVYGQMQGVAAQNPSAVYSASVALSAEAALVGVPSDHTVDFFG
jgi:V8-like Glu-specific endopeptidase